MRKILGTIWHKTRLFQIAFYITELSEEIERRVTKKLFQELSRTENRILGALSRLDDFLMNPLIQDHSGTTPETSRNAYGANQGTNEDDSQRDPHPEAGVLQSQTTQNSGPEDAHDTYYLFYDKNILLSLLLFKIMFLDTI